MQFRHVPGNEPLARPGAYRITHIESGRCYVGVSGNVAKRLRQHARYRTTSTFIHRAVTKYGAHAFLAEPLYYSTGAGEELLAVEADLIADNDAVAHGFNIMQSSVEYGPVFGEQVKRGLAAPETRALMSASAKQAWSDPAERIRRLAATEPTRQANAQRFRTAVRTDEHKARSAEGVRNKAKTDASFRGSCAARARALSMDPDLVARRNAAILASYERDPARRANAAEKASALHQARREWAASTGYSGALNKITLNMMKAQNVV